MRAEELPPPADWSAWAAEGIAIDAVGGDGAPTMVALEPDAHARCAPTAIAWRDPQLVLRADGTAHAALSALATGPGRLALCGWDAFVSLHLAPGETLRARPDAALLASGGCIRLPPEAGAGSWSAGLRRYAARERPGLLLLGVRGCLFRLELAAGERILVAQAGLLCVRGAIVLEPPGEAAVDGGSSLIVCQGEGTLIVQSGVAARLLP